MRVNLTCVDIKVIKRKFKYLIQKKSNSFSKVKCRQDFFNVETFIRLTFTIVEATTCSPPSPKHSSRQIFHEIYLVY